jgi:hypothetical protein
MFRLSFSSNTLKAPGFQGITELLHSELRSNGGKQPKQTALPQAANCSIPCAKAAAMTLAALTEFARFQNYTGAELPPLATEKTAFVWAEGAAAVNAPPKQDYILQEKKLYFQASYNKTHISYPIYENRQPD